MALDLRLRLLPKQQEYVESTARTTVYEGGIGAGKSIANSALIIRLAILYPGIDILVCAPTYGMLRDTIMREFANRCPRAILQSFTHGTYPEAVFLPNRGRQSTARFRAFDDAGKPKSITVGTALVDEVTEMREDVHDEIRNRVRQDGMPNFHRYSTNADSKSHWFYRRYIEIAERDGNTPRLHRIATTTFDNYLLPESYREDSEIAKKNRPGYYKQKYLGEWGDFDEDIIGAFDRIPEFTSPYRVAFIDTSYSDSSSSDRTALSIVGFVPQHGKENRYWPIEFTGKSWQKSITNPEVIIDMLKFLDRFKPIETQLESQLGDSTKIFIDNFKESERRLGLAVKNHWTIHHQSGNKHTRIMFEVAGNKDRMRVLDDTPPEYLNNVISYKKKYEPDDEADSLAGAVELWRMSPNLREYITRAERMRV